MTPLRLSHTWARRLYVGLFSLSILYVILYVLQLTGAVAIPALLRIDIFVAVGALLVTIASAVLFVTVEKVNSFIPGFAAYAVFIIITAATVQQTGGVSSFYLAVWTLVIFFAPVFGAYGWLPVIVMAGSYTAGAYLSGDLSPQAIIIIVFSTILPLAAGMFIWRDAEGTEDPSERNVKNLASQLSEVATKSEIIVNAIGDGVIALDSQGVIQLINPAAQAILGWGKQDALLLHYKSILKLADENNGELEPSKDPIQQVLNTNQQARSNNLTALTQSNKKINVAVVVSPIGDPGAGVIVVFRDVTNERAEEREQAEFISTASHEMRTPVASIEGYLGLAMNPATATIDARGQDYIMKAHEAAQHLGRLFQDLLDVSKSEDGRMANTPKVVDITQFANTIAEGLRQKAQDKGLQLVFAPTQASTQKKIMPVYFVNQDNDHIREVLDNLIENAIKYTPQGTVVVDVNGTEDRVVISVKDSGLGIPAEDVPHLFQKFYRVNNPDRQAIGGTGLGLYLSRRLAEAMQGRLWVESVFGQGSTFFFELPRISSDEAARLKSSEGMQITTPQVTPTQATPTTQIPVSIAPDQPATAPLAATPEQAQTPQPAAPTNTAVQPATTVPRGESLTEAQKAERVRQLEAMAAQQQRGSVTPTPRVQ